MAMHIITHRHTPDNLDAGSWTTVVSGWSQTVWNGDTGSQTVPAHGPDLSEVFIQINGGPENDLVIPLTANILDIAVSFDYQVFLSAGNEVLLVNQFNGAFVTITGDTSGSMSGAFGGPVGTWQQVLDAHLQIFGWQFQSSNAAQAGGTARLIITNFQLLITYPNAPVTFAKLPLVPGRVPARQGKGR